MGNQTVTTTALTVTQTDATATSRPIDMRHMSRLSVQTNDDGGGMTGTLLLEQLNEEHDVERANDSANWQDTGVSIGATDDFDNVENFNARWARIRWTYAAGTGQKIVTVTGKNV